MAIPYTFTKVDLNMGEDFVSQVEAALLSAGQDHPIEWVLDQAADKVASYTSKFILAENRWRRLVRDIALRECYTLIGSCPTAVKESAERADKELEDIRDGKFALPPAVEAPIPTEAGLAKWGSGKRISAR